MTYDTAIWKPANDLPDPTAEFDRRYDLSDSRYPNYRRPIPELVQLADRSRPSSPDRARGRTFATHSTVTSST